MMPCRKNKCILQAACKNKQTIYCDDFLNYIENKYKARGEKGDMGSYSVHRRIWTRLQKHHPNLTKVLGDKKPGELIQYSIVCPTFGS